VAAACRQRLFSLVLVLIWAGFAINVKAQQALSAQERQQASVAVMRTVLGILSFVRWPNPAEPSTLCVTGEVQYFAWFGNELRQSNGKPLRVQRYASIDVLPNDCSVLYLGQLPEATQKALFARFLGRQVLVMSEAAKECTLGYMFCLTLGKRRVNFVVNLDSLSRSRLRVHPNVLKLSRERP